MEWSVGTVTNDAQRLGLSFDRETVRAAEARQVDLREQRQAMQQELLDLAREQSLGLEAGTS